MKPLGKRVVIEREVMGEKIGRIIIPEKARHKPQVGRVTAIGPAVTTVTVGESVLFGKFSSLDIEGYGVFVNESDLIAAVNTATTVMLSRENLLGRIRHSAYLLADDDPMKIAIDGVLT